MATGEREAKLMDDDDDARLHKSAGTDSI